MIWEPYALHLYTATNIMRHPPLTSPTTVNYFLRVLPTVSVHGSRFCTAGVLARLNSLASTYDCIPAASVVVLVSGLCHEHGVTGEDDEGPVRICQRLALIPRESQCGFTRVGFSS